MEILVSATSRATSGGALLFAIGLLMVWASADASAAVQAKRCSPHQSVLNGECVDNSFINPELPGSCSRGAACFRRDNHKRRAHKTNS
jgi:hypothetical protein